MERANITYAGENHHLANLTNGEVETIRRLYRERSMDGRRVWSVRRLAEKFEISKTHCNRIINFQSRPYG